MEVYNIMKKIDQLPPLQIEEFCKNYIGLKVNWITEYNSADKQGDDKIRVRLHLISKSFRPISVCCEVNLSEHKKFTILNKKAKVRVNGEITIFEEYNIELSNVTLSF